MSAAFNNPALRKISSEQLRPGMYLHRLCGSWMAHPFWRTSFLIRDEQQIALIRDSGITEVWVDTERGEAPHDGDGASAALAEDDAHDDSDRVAADLAADPSCPEPVAAGGSIGPVAASSSATAARHSRLDDEFLSARRICAHGKQVMAALFGEARLGNALRTTDAMALVDAINSSVLRNRSALISVARLKAADDYTYMHSVTVCALMVALSQQLGLSEEETRQAGFGGLLHDVGKARIPLELLNKPGSLSEPEFATIRSHPQHGVDLLVRSGLQDAQVLDVVLHHHERIDGSGYPHGLAGDGISVLARMGAICDVYDAITSNRPYKAAWDPAQSLQRMNAWKGHFDPRLLQHFIRSIGIYPIGTLVRLESDKLGVVCEPGVESLLKPTVRAFFSATRRRQIPIHDIDLAAAGCQDRIVGVEAAASWGLTGLERLWMP